MFRPLLLGLRFLFYNNALSIQLRWLRKIVLLVALGRSGDPDFAAVGSAGLLSVDWRRAKSTEFAFAENKYQRDSFGSQDGWMNTIIDPTLRCLIFGRRLFTLGRSWYLPDSRTQVSMRVLYNLTCLSGTSRWIGNTSYMHVET